MKLLADKNMSGFKYLTPEEASKHDGLELQDRFTALVNIKNLFNEWEPWYQAFFINNLVDVS